MRKLVKKSEAYFVKIGDTIIYHYDCNRLFYWYRDGVECGTVFSTSIDRTNTKTIIIDPLFVNYKPSGAVDWFFSGLAKLEKIIGLEYFNTSEFTSTSYMFEGCSSLIDLNLMGFNTSNVRFMVGMFFGCFKLKNINLSNFDTSNVINLSGMFSNCESLMSIDLKGFDTSKVLNINNMFCDCASLVSLDLSNFDTSKVTSIYGMFSRCDKLKNINLSSFDTSNVIDMCYMFHCCKSLKNIDISNFNTSKVTGMRNMFNKCEKLKTIYVSDGWNIGKVKESSNMFDYCFNLVGGKGTKFDSGGTDKIFANIDEGISNPGYLTTKK